LADPLNDPVISRAFSLQTKIRFLRVGPSVDDMQRTLKEIITTIDQETPQVSPTRARGLSSPTPFSRSNSATGTTGPNLERRGSEASFSQLKHLSFPPPPSPAPAQVTFKKARPFQLSISSSEKQGGSSPPQSPKTIKSMATLLSDPVPQEYMASRFPFAIPSLPGTKPSDPPSPAGTAPSLPGSRRHSRILDSGSDFAPSVEEEWLDRWPLEDQEEFAQAMEGLGLTGDGGGKTWEELIDRLLSPGIPSDGMNAIGGDVDFRRRFYIPLLGVLPQVCGAE
jgi:hypothetical protein